jgi:hypothetical protein
MSTSAGINQYAVLDEKLGKPSAAKMHHILAKGGDLFGMMAEADLSVVDREAFKQLLFPAGALTIPWTPVEEYLDRIRERNQERQWGLTEKHFGKLEEKLQCCPHTGNLKPTGVTLSLGEGLRHDWREAVKWLIDSTDSCSEFRGAASNPFNSAFLKEYPGSEPKLGPYIAPAKLDIGEYWDREDGHRLREVRKPHHRWPGTEILWLMALNPQVVKLLDGEQLPYLMMPGLLYDGYLVPCVRDKGVDGTRQNTAAPLKLSSVVSFRS